MKRQRKTTQMKQQNRNTKVQINEEEIGKLPKTANIPQNAKAQRRFRGL